MPTPLTERRLATPCIITVLVLICVGVNVRAQSASAGAEYAMRWSPEQGGPGDADAALKVLKLTYKAKDVAQFQVRYFAVSAPLPASGPVPILRERTKNGGPETTWKYRSSGGFPAPALAEWACPLRSSKTAKDEVDVTLLSSGAVRTYSRSCTSKGSVAETIPPDIVAQPKGCSVRMRRIEAGAVTVEEWNLNGGKVVLEISSRGLDVPASLRAFQADIAEKLMAAGARPIDRSKSELGSQCP